MPSPPSYGPNTHGRVVYGTYMNLYMAVLRIHAHQDREARQAIVAASTQNMTKQEGHETDQSNPNGGRFV